MSGIDLIVEMEGNLTCAGRTRSLTKCRNTLTAVRDARRSGSLDVPSARIDPGGRIRERVWCGA